MIPILVSCNPKSPLEDYNYSEDFNVYFSNTFETVLQDQAIKHLFVVPLSSCTPCVEATLSFFIEFSGKDVGIITCGLPDNENTLNYIKTISTLENVWMDNDGDISKYRTNIGAPYYLAVNEGKIRKGLELDNKKIELIRPLFLK